MVLAEYTDKHKPSDTIAANGMVAAAHPLAAQAGVEILKKGGNAIDAAVASAFALNAVEPHASGLGGGGFMLIYIAETEEIKVIDYREHAPRATTKDIFSSNQSENEGWSRLGGKAVAVPGTLMGLNLALEKYGTITLAEAMVPAIYYLENGFEISEALSTAIKNNYDKMTSLNDQEKVAFLKEGFPLEEGDILIQTDLAKTYYQILDKGIEYFYGGALGEKIVEAVRTQNGIMTIEDLRNYKPHIRKPVVGNYRGYDIYSMCPPSLGGIYLIQILNVIENFDIARLKYHGLTHVSIMAEAMKMAFTDRAKYTSDTEYVKGIPIDWLTSKEYAKSLADQINIGIPKQLMPAVPLYKPEHHSTSHISVADAAGNMVALTQTINSFFGSGVIVPETGIIMNNEMDDFSSNPKSFNAPEPGKIPLSSMSPTIIKKDGRPFMVLGTPGGTRIFTAMAQIISNVIDFGMNMDEAIEAPRMHYSISEGEEESICCENRFPSITIDALQILGNEVDLKEAYDLYFGGAQGILLKNAEMHGGADSRRDGVAVGF